MSERLTLIDSSRCRVGFKAYRKLFLPVTVLEKTRLRCRKKLGVLGSEEHLPILTVQDASSAPRSGRRSLTVSAAQITSYQELT